MTVGRGTRVATLAFAAVCASGCAIRMTHRCGVPQPVVEAAPGAGKLPLTVAVRYLPPPGASEVLMQRDPHHLWTVDPAPPTRALFERLATSVFERRVDAPAGAPVAPVDAVLEVRVERLRFAWVPVGMGPYTAAITYRATLRSADGAEIAALDLEGAGARGAVYELATHCKGIGDAVALAMQDAGGKLVTGLGADPAVVAWLGGRGIARPALAVRAPGVVSAARRRRAARRRVPAVPARAVDRHAARRAARDRRTAAARRSPGTVAARAAVGPDPRRPGRVPG